MPDESLETAVQDWLREHGATVLKVARAYTRTADDCQDLAQEILLQVWRSAGRFEGRARVSTWVYRVALNTALGWRRKEGRRRARQRPLLAVEGVAAAGPDSPEEFARREAVDRLYAAIHQLAPADVALVLLYLDGLTYREMAEVLGIAEGYVGVKLNRAKKALTELLKEGRHDP